MSISDGQFYSLFRRMLQKVYKDPTGIPQIEAKDLKRPQKRSIITSNGANWDRISVDRPTYIWTPDKRQINYVPGSNPGDVSADTSKPYFASVTGYVKLFAPGEWFINTPLLTGDVENKTTALVYGEVPPNDVNFTPADVIGQVAGQLPVVTNPSRSAWGHDQKSVAVAGTAVQLNSLAVVSGFKLAVKARPANGGYIYVGNSKANAEDHAKAFILGPGDPFPAAGITNASLLWIDGDVALDGVCVATEA